MIQITYLRKLAANVAGKDLFEASAKSVDTHPVLLKSVPGCFVTEERVLDGCSIAVTILELLLARVSDQAPAKVERVLLALHKLQYLAFGTSVN